MVAQFLDKTAIEVIRTRRAPQLRVSTAVADVFFRAGLCALRCNAFVLTTCTTPLFAMAKSIMREGKNERERVIHHHPLAPLALVRSFVMLIMGCEGERCRGGERPALPTLYEKGVIADMACWLRVSRVVARVRRYVGPWGCLLLCLR